ncbi:unnamed protein product [Peniophora sp. CBMAI 1063]|nr:unnamed protein product [Peniophora sp. CBMAI 1063]
MTAPASLTEFGDVWTRQLDGLRNDAGAIESSMLVAQAVVRHHAALLNALNRVVSLPAEVLESIFLAVQLTGRTSATTDPVNRDWSHESEWILVTHVCRRWRQIALSYPSLWTDIDLNTYGIPLCKEMLIRVTSHKFALSASLNAHENFLLGMDLRTRIPGQLSRLKLDFGENVTHSGAFLDTLWSQAGSEAHSGLALEELDISYRSSILMFWASLELVVPRLKCLRFTHTCPGGGAPSSMKMLRDVTFNTVDLTSRGRVTPGILDLVPLMPVLESATFIGCVFSPLDADKAALPSSMKLFHCEGHDEWSLQQCRALSRMLMQTTGDRVFVVGSATSHVAEELFEEVKDMADVGFDITEITVEVTGWYTTNATVTLQNTLKEEASSLCIKYTRMPSTCWPTFCSSMEGIDMQDASVRLICDQATSCMISSDNDELYGLRGWTMSRLHLTGRMASWTAADIFIALRAPIEGGGPSVAFPCLQDFCLEHSPSSATVEIPNLDMVQVDDLYKELDEGALYLLWYARQRRDQDLGLLRTVALPTDLLQRQWVIELNDLLERRVITYDEYMAEEDGEGDDTETTECRAVVLYRPVMRALRFWETWILPFVPAITTLGILWTRSRIT